jgi:hypothetical protein
MLFSFSIVLVLQLLIHNNYPNGSQNMELLTMMTMMMMTMTMTMTPKNDLIRTMITIEGGEVN